MTPTIYEPRVTDFSHNGLGFLKDSIRCEVLEERNGKYQLELEYPAQSRFSEYFDYGYQIKAKPNDQEEYHVFVIKSTYKDTITDSIIVYAQSRTYNLGNREVQQAQINSLDAHAAMKVIEREMDEPSDIVLMSDIPTVSSTIFEAQNVLNCIAGEQGSLLQRWGGEIKREPFRLSLLQRRGRDNVGTVRYGKDLTGLKIKFDWESVVTKVLPWAEIQNSEGVTERIYGKPVISELVSNYPDVMAAHIQFTEDQGVTDKSSLDSVASKYFTSINPGVDKPKINIELSIEKLSDSEEAKEFAKLRNYGLCDTFNVYHKKYNIDIDTKIISVLYDSLREKTISLTAGDAQPTFYQKQNYDFQEVIKTLSKKEYMSNFIDYITDLINGIDGGSILQYPKNRPNSIYFLDADTKEEAKDVIVINHKGIGFSRTGWKGPFIYGWTIDGILNADFINAGTLRGITIHSANEYYDIKLENGIIDFLDLKNNKVLGYLRGNSIDIDGTLSSGLYMGIKAPYDFRFIVDESSGERVYPIIINPKNQYNDTTIRFGTEAVFWEKAFFNKDVHITGKLFVNGKEITGGGSGGGVTPPELTTEQEKNAWQIWQFFKNKGWTEEAIAGMLGNMQSESGIIPDIDEISGGGGYGLVQWTPKSKLVDWCNEKGLDYRTLDAQCQRIQWEVENNVQWFANPQRPELTYISFVQFTQLTDVKLAADYFIAFYEHPADPWQPIRQTQAVYWYDKLKNLGGGGEATDGWKNPVQSAYSITQEWDHIGWGTTVIHGGIDVASAGGAKVPIFAAKAGTVISIVNNHATGGNYLIIDHGDGYWSYYGHLDSFAVSQGQKVTNADQIGIMGETGLASGVHLHFEVWKGSQWNRINPRDVISF